MSDKDLLILHGISPYALVDEFGIAVNGTSTLTQLAARGFQTACSVDGSGVASSGSTLRQLYARGIEPVCLVDEIGVAADGSTLTQLRHRAIFAMCPVDVSGIAQGGTATLNQLRQRGIKPFCPIDESGTATTVGSLLSGNSVVALFGDSLEAQNNYASATGGSEELSILSRGYMAWQRILDPRGKWDNWYDAAVTGRLWQGQNQGFSGDQASDAIARLSTLTGIAGLKVVGCGLGTNDINAGTALATIQTNLTTIYTAILAVSGVTLVILTPPPRALAAWASGSVARLKWIDLCTWMQAYADANPSRVKIVRRDLVLSIADADRTPITSPQAVLQTDNVHLTPYGGYLVASDANGWNARLAALVGSFTDFPSHPVTGELFPNPLLTGTGGTEGAGASGDTATNCAIAVSGTGVSCVASKDVDDTQILTITSLGTGSTSDLVRFGINSATITPPADGTWVRSASRIAVDANAILLGVTTLSRGQPSGSNMYAYGMKHDSPNLWPNVALAEHWQQSPPWVTRASTTGLICQVFCAVDGTKTGSAVVRVKKMHLYPITEPKTSLGF